MLTNLVGRAESPIYPFAGLRRGEHRVIHRSDGLRWLILPKARVRGNQCEPYLGRSLLEGVYLPSSFKEPGSALSAPDTHRHDA